MSYDTMWQLGLILTLVAWCCSTFCCTNFHFLCKQTLRLFEDSSRWLALASNRNRQRAILRQLVITKDAFNFTYCHWVCIERRYFLTFSELKPHYNQGCQMVCFQTKIPILGKFWRALEWKKLVNFMVIWNILRSFGEFYGRMVMLWQFGIFPSIWNIVFKTIWQPWL
jgi:hypothetical protein